MSTLRWKHEAAHADALCATPSYSSSIALNSDKGKIDGASQTLIDKSATQEVHPKELQSSQHWDHQALNESTIGTYGGANTSTPPRPWTKASIGLNVGIPSSPALALLGQRVPETRIFESQTNQMFSSGGSQSKKVRVGGGLENRDIFHHEAGSLSSEGNGARGEVLVVAQAEDAGGARQYELQCLSKCTQKSESDHLAIARTPPPGGKHEESARRTFVEAADAAESEPGHLSIARSLPPGIAHQEGSRRAFTEAADAAQSEPAQRVFTAAQTFSSGLEMSTPWQGRVGGPVLCGEDEMALLCRRLQELESVNSAADGTILRQVRPSLH